MTNKIKVFGFALFLFILLIFQTFIWLKVNDTKVLVEEIDNNFFLRNEINEKVLKLMNNSRSEEVYEFYDRYTNSREYTHLTISACILQAVPINIAFAIAYTESRFNPSALNVNTNGTVDIGLFQLNSDSFKSYTKDYLFEEKNNIKLGVYTLASRFKKYKNWIKAIISYNRGYRFDGKGVDYLINVLNYEDYLDIEFNLEF